MYFKCAFRAKTKITLRELQSLIGKLNFACRAILPGRVYADIIEGTCGLSKQQNSVQVS